MLASDISPAITPQEKITQRDKNKHPHFGLMEETSRRTHLGRFRGPLQVARHKEVDDRPTDALGGQDEGQRPPEAQHFSDGGVALKASDVIKLVCNAVHSASH